MGLRVEWTLVLALGAGAWGQERKPAAGPTEAVLGAATRAPTRDEVREFALPSEKRPQGQVVVSVDAGGPAEKAGIAKSDVILVFNGSKIYSRDALDDLIRAAAPGSEVKVRLKRPQTYREEEVTVKLGGGPATRKGIVWEHAGIEHLDAALAQAKKERKPLLVGLAGAETWWPTTRFESGSLSAVLDNEKVVEASKSFVRIILRRPQTYEFRERFRGAPIPGLVFMDGAGAVRHTVALGGNDLLNVVLQSMNRAAR